MKPVRFHGTKDERLEVIEKYLDPSKVEVRTREKSCSGFLSFLSKPFFLVLKGLVKMREIPSKPSKPITVEMKKENGFFLG